MGFSAHLCQKSFFPVQQGGARPRHAGQTFSKILLKYRNKWYMKEGGHQARPEKDEYSGLPAHTMRLYFKCAPEPPGNLADFFFIKIGGYGIS